MPLLEVKGLEKRFGQLTALSGVNLTIEEFEFHGLIGPNGSGKSTLMQCIAGAQIPSGGTISLLGRPITALPPEERARAGLSLKFQITSIFPALSVYDNLLLALQSTSGPWQLLRSASRRALHGRVLETLTMFQLDGRAGDLAGLLSHGEQQWLEIAMAMALRPRLLLLDEPTGGMSLEERRHTGELLRGVREHCSLLIVEHDLDFVKDLCNVLTVLDQGQVLAEGSAQDIEGSARVKEVYLRRV